MPSHTLQEAEEAYLAHHRARNHSPATIDHYRWTFTDLHRFLAATGQPEDLSVLTVQTLQAFHTWLVETTLKKEYRGGHTCAARDWLARRRGGIGRGVSPELRGRRKETADWPIEDGTGPRSSTAGSPGRCGAVRRRA